MNLHTIELWIGWAGAAAIVALDVVVLVGFARGQRRARGRTSGTGLRYLRLRPWAYGVMALVYAGLCYLLRRPLPLSPTPAARTSALVAGSLL